MDKKTGKAPDVEALKSSKVDLDKAKKTLDEANSSLTTKDKKVEMKSKTTDTTGELPKKFLEEKYAPLEKAYFKRMASKKVFDKYKGDNDSMKSKIDDYVAAQEDYITNLEKKP